MTRVLLIALFYGAVGFNAIAHNAKIATYTLRDTGKGWYIEMNFAQAAVDAQMLKMYDEKMLREMTLDEYKKSFLKYLNANFHLKVDGERIKLISGGILLGNHQTDVKYVLPEIPNKPQKMSIHIPMFEDVYNHTNLFRIYRGGETFTKFFLNADNDFNAAMVLEDGNIYVVEMPSYNKFANVSAVVVGLLFLAGIGMVIRTYLKNTKLRKAQ